jgi:hypothetical protein
MKVQREYENKKEYKKGKELRDIRDSKQEKK